MIVLWIAIFVFCFKREFAAAATVFSSVNLEMQKYYFYLIYSSDFIEILLPLRFI